MWCMRAFMPTHHVHVHSQLCMSRFGMKSVQMQTHHLQDCAREKVVLTRMLSARVSFNDFQDVLYDVHVCTCPPRSGMSLSETCVRTVGLAVSEVNRLGERPTAHAYS